MAVLKINSRLKASTLVEVIAAMIIIMLSFGLALMVSLNLFRSAGFEMRYKARLVVNNIAIETIRTKEFIDADIEDEPFIVSRKILPGENEKLKVLWLQAKGQDGRILAERKQILYLP